MKNRGFLCVAFISVVVGGAMSPGCRALSNRGIARDYVAVWEIEENRTVRFVAEMEVDERAFTARRVRDALCVEIVSDGAIIRQWTIGRWEDGSRPKSAHVSLRHLEARSDAAGQRIWILDTSSKRAVASVDLRTGATTGIQDAAPPWAKLDGGVVLPKASPRPRQRGSG